MTSFIRKLALVAVLAAAVPATRAHACDHDDDRFTAAPMPPPYDPRSMPAYDPGRPPYDPARPAPWREGWRHRELEELRGEFRALDEARADFHARWGWHPRKVARFERWYALRRAELERRWNALTAPAYARR